MRNSERDGDRKGTRMDCYHLLTKKQAEVSRKVLAEESTKREHLVVSLSGAHAYGFPSPDSDVDLKAVHIAPTAALLGLHPTTPTRDMCGILEGVEIDYTSNELHGVLMGVVRGNGNFIERLLGTNTLQGGPLLDELRPLVRGVLCRAVSKHYRGFARGQVHEFEKNMSAKKALYVLRTALTGTHLLLTGEVVTDLTLLVDEYGLGEARQLVEAKKAGERIGLDACGVVLVEALVARAFETLDLAEAKSRLPVEPERVDELDSWLIDVRCRRIGR